MAGVLQTTFSITLQNKFGIFIKISQMIQLMAWHWTGDNQLYELYTFSYTNIPVNNIDI